MRKKIFFVLIFSFIFIGEALAHDFFITKVFYKNFINQQDEIVTVKLFVYGNNSDIVRKSCSFFYANGWKDKQVSNVKEYLLITESIEFSEDHGKIWVYQYPCDQSRLFNKHKYRSGAETFDEYFKGIADKVEICIKEKYRIE